MSERRIVPSRDKTTPIAISPSGAGVAIWVGDEVKLGLDWKQAHQLHRLLADQFRGAREAGE